MAEESEAIWKLNINDAAERFEFKFHDVVWLTTIFSPPVFMYCLLICVSTLECCVVSHIFVQHSHASGMTAIT